MKINVKTQRKGGLIVNGKEITVTITIAEQYTWQKSENVAYEV